MKKKANILIFKFALSLGGGETFNFTLAEELPPKDHLVKFFSNFKPFCKKIRSLGPDAKKIYWGQEVGAKRYLPQYFLLLPINYVRFFFILLFNRKKDRKNVVIFQSLNEKIFASRLAKRMGYGVFWVEHLSVNPWLVKSFFRNSYMRNYRIIDKIIVISKTIKKELVEDIGIPDDKIEVIYNGIDLKRFFAFDEKIVENEKKKYGLYKDSKIIGFDGRLHREKGLDVLVNSFFELTRRFEHIYLFFVGEGSERKNLEELTRKLGIENKVFFLGFKNKEEIPLFLNTIDIFVLPSKVRESFGIVLIEAMAVGKVVVASNIGGIPEIIDDGVTGFLFTPGNEKELTDHLSKILSNEKLKKEIEANALKKVRDKFSINAMISKLEKLINL